MDLAKLDLEAAASEGIKVNLRHPVTLELLEDDNEKPMVIVILGRDSKKWQQASRKIGNRNASKYKGKIPNKVVESSLREIIAECTVSFPNNNIIFKGKKVKCDPVSCLELYNERPWIVEQLSEAAADRSQLFLGDPEKS